MHNRIEDLGVKVPAVLLEKAKSRKDTLEDMITANVDGLQRDIIMERYYQRMATTAKLKSGSKVWEQQLGVIQQSIRAKKEIIEYLTPLWEELH